MKHLCLVGVVPMCYWTRFAGLQGVKKGLERGCEAGDEDGDYEDEMSEINFRNLTRTPKNPRESVPTHDKVPALSFLVLRV